MMTFHPEIQPDVHRMRLRNSFWFLWGQQDIDAPRAVVECMRDAMQRALSEHLGPEGRELKRCVHLATDIDGLWYLRPEIMSAIARRQGEARAQECLAELTELFQGLHPGAVSSRFPMP